MEQQVSSLQSWHDVGIIPLLVKLCMLAFNTKNEPARIFLALEHRHDCSTYLCLANILLQAGVPTYSHTSDPTCQQELQLMRKRLAAIERVSMATSRGKSQVCIQTSLTCLGEVKRCCLVRLTLVLPVRTGSLRPCQMCRIRQQATRHMACSVIQLRCEACT